jgi:hypothetical protein
VASTDLSSKPPIPFDWFGLPLPAGAKPRLAAWQGKRRWQKQAKKKQTMSAA